MMGFLGFPTVKCKNSINTKVLINPPFALKKAMRKAFYKLCFISNGGWRLAFCYCPYICKRDYIYRLNKQGYSQVFIAKSMNRNEPCPFLGTGKARF
jgi:hypothetical protein